MMELTTEDLLKANMLHEGQLPCYIEACRGQDLNVTVHYSGEITVVVKNAEGETLNVLGVGDE